MRFTFTWALPDGERFASQALRSLNGVSVPVRVDDQLYTGTVIEAEVTKGGQAALVTVDAPGLTEEMVTGSSLTRVEPPW